MGKVELKDYTLLRCDALWRQYVQDPMMSCEPYSYDPAWVKSYHARICSDKSRYVFAVCLDNEVIGEAQIKRIDNEKRCGTLSLILANDRFKNRGFGRCALQKLIGYAFDTLNLLTIYADCTARNSRSAHLMESEGFAFVCEKDAMRYYVLKRKPE
ncbi:MAG: GNAT family N-acetyltransferase [Clostridia bacterium]|nr:GNAT family N-acetyltransferase [Clostridia bacterium]